LAQSLDPAIREALLARVRFYRELGLAEFYRRPVDPKLAAQFALEPENPGVPAPNQNLFVTQTSSFSPVPLLPTKKGESCETELAPESQPRLFQEDQPILSRQLIPAPPRVAAAVPVTERAAALQLIREEIGDCTRCQLHSGRNKLVFGDGSPSARLMFVGEGPGADEDAQGLPFVGRAGQLLNNMITAMGLKREEVYIANVVKCRPPGNRVPEPDEMATCSPFLFRQIDVIHPQVLVALGATAATCLLGRRQPLAGLRGRIHIFRGTQLIVTYHPAYLLRDPRQKKEAWADLQIAMRELGLKLPTKRKG
jgi:uracil-DNA glycosylase